MKLIFLSTLIGLAYSACSDGDQQIEGLCYKFVNQQVIYEVARSWCHQNNAYLAYIPDLDTSNLVASYARTAFQLTDGDVWVGASRSCSGCSFQWDNGLPVNFTNFGTNNGQNYVGIKVSNGKWDTFPYNKLNRFVCSYDPSTPTLSTQPAPTTSQGNNGCQDGDQQIEGQCFKFINQPAIYEVARNWCHQNNLNLAYVPDLTTSNSVASYSRIAFQITDGDVWIGLSRSCSGCSFQWDNGLPGNFTNFGTNNGQNYVGIRVFNGKWDTFKYNDIKRFVCSYNPVLTTPTPSITPAQTNECLHGDQEIRGLCYKFVNYPAMYEIARNWCRQNNAYLAFVPDLVTSNLVASYSRSAFQITAGEVWIGASRTCSECTFKWDNGLPVIFTNFEANNGKNYVGTRLSNGKWGTFSSNSIKRFVCSYAPLKTNTVPLTSVRNAH